MFNACSIVNKTDNLALAIDAQSIDIVLITESKLDDSIPDSFLVNAVSVPHNQFTCFRKDRNRQGGGVCMLIRSCIKTIPVVVPARFAHLELAAVDILNSDIWYRIVTLYRPPYYDDEARALMLDIVACLQLLSSINYPTIIAGDLNLPHANWCDYIGPNDNIHLPFVQFAQEFGFVQYTVIPTRGAHVLDLVLCNDPFLVSECIVDEPIGSHSVSSKPSDHCSVHFKILGNLLPDDPLKQGLPAFIFDFKNADFHGLNAYLMQIDWCAALVNSNDTNTYWEKFIQIVNNGIEIFVPVKKTHVKKGRQFNVYPRHIRNLYVKKQSAWRAFARFKTEQLKQKYLNLSAMCQNAINTFWEEKENALVAEGDIGQFYRYINNKIVSNSGIGVIKDETGKMLYDDTAKADCFRRHFESVFTQDNNTPAYTASKAPLNSFTDIIFSYDNVFKAIMDLKAKPSKGPDGLPSFFIKQLAESISFPLMLIFSQSFESGKVPDIWKTAIVTPVFKKGLASDVNNYRPISLTCTCCKIMESVIKRQVLNYLLHHNLISKHQHGFLSNHSTCTQLIECTNDWTLAINSHNPVDVAYIDFSKAFDSVCHSKLICKLRSFGIGGKLLAWITDYLSDRTQVVKVGCQLSSVSFVCSGVPQGSVLGPLLFLMFINDIVDEFGDFLTTKLFADDVKIYVVIDDPSKIDCLQLGLDKLHMWSVKWQLNIAAHKCCVLHVGHKNINHEYNINNIKLIDATEVVDLGVTVDSNMRFDKHINKMVTKAHQRAALISRCFKSKKSDVLFRAFTVYVRPILEYCSAVWNPGYLCDVNKIESVQRRFTKRLRGLHSLSYVNRLEVLNTQSLELRRLKIDLVTMYKMMFSASFAVGRLNLIQLYDNVYCTRGHNFRLMKQHHTVNCYSNSFVGRIVNVWNSLPASAFDYESVSGFKRFIDGYDLSQFLCL